MFLFVFGCLGWIGLVWWLFCFWGLMDRWVDGLDWIGLDWRVEEEISLFVGLVEVEELVWSWEIL